ncbi:MAG TPA: YciI family protein [Bacteroidia bacterium]
MKKFLFFIAALSLISCGSETQNNNSTPNTTNSNTSSAADTALARRLGADEYGMKPYTLVFLVSGPKPVSGGAALDSLMKGHLKNLRNLLESGKMVLAGPLMEDINLRGICIYNCAPEEARTLAENDPAVKSGHFAVEVHSWYGTAALTQLMDIHKKMEKKSFSEMK